MKRRVLKGNKVDKVLGTVIGVWAVGLMCFILFLFVSSSPYIQADEPPEVSVLTTEVCAVHSVKLTWVVGTTLGACPSGGFVIEALDTVWEVNIPKYVWLGINCTSELGLDDLFIIFETGADVFEITRTEPPVGWTSVVPFESFESGAYVYGPEGGFHLSSGITYAEFEIVPLVTECHDLEVYFVQVVGGSEV